MHWRLRGLTSLHWQHFDGDWVIYDEGSGQTLSADPVMAAVLMAVEGGCTSQPEIEAQARRDLGVGADVELSDTVSEGLMFLQRLGLLDANAA